MTPSDLLALGALAIALASLAGWWPARPKPSPLGDKPVLQIPPDMLQKALAAALQAAFQSIATDLGVTQTITVNPAPGGAPPPLPFPPAGAKP